MFVYRYIILFSMSYFVLWLWVCKRVFLCIHPVCVRVRVCMLSAVSQCACRGPVYLVFITKPFTEAPIRIKPLSAHTDHRTQPVSVCVCVCVSVSERDRKRGGGGGGGHYLHVYVY